MVEQSSTIQVKKEVRKRWNPDEFKHRLEEVGHAHYHDKHPFHTAMHEGSLSREQIRAWVANRYYYQKSVPIKDAAILSNLPTRALRREWIKRILDHDGTEGEDGGIESWLRLGEATGLPREEMISEDHVVSGVRFAVDSYVHFARTKPWVEAVASSLTELFSPDLMSYRVKVLEQYYPWIQKAGLQYFQDRLQQAPKDSAHALHLVITHCQTPDAQQKAVSALRFKCDVLWAQLDAIEKTFPD